MAAAAKGERLVGVPTRVLMEETAQFSFLLSHFAKAAASPLGSWMARFVALGRTTICLEKELRTAGTCIKRTQRPAFSFS